MRENADDRAGGNNMEFIILFVILDDNVFDFRDDRNLWERLLLTNGIENAAFAAQTPAVETIIFHDYIKMFSQ